jgi:hypothetical protein
MTNVARKHERALPQMEAIRMQVHTFPWISYLMGPSNSAPRAISFVTVLLMSGTLKDSIEEYTLCVARLLQKYVSTFT